MACLSQHVCTSPIKQASCPEGPLWSAVCLPLLAAKKPEDQLFETMDATDLNKTLKDLMDGLSVKVFRTYNASITLDRLLWEPSDSEVVDAKKADYDRANKEVNNHVAVKQSMIFPCILAANCARGIFAHLVCVSGAVGHVDLHRCCKYHCRQPGECCNTKACKMLAGLQCKLC